MRIPRARYTVTVALLVFITGLVLAAPTITRHALVRLISDKLQVQVDIETVELGLLDGVAQINGLAVAGKHDSSLRGARLYADIDMGALVSGDIVAESIVLEGVRLRIVESPAGEPVIVVPLAAGVDGAPEGEEEVEVELPLFELKQLSLIDTQIDVVLPPVQGRFTVTELTLSRLTTMTSEPAELRLAADWNGAPLKLAGTLAAFEESPWFEGEVSLQRAGLRELDPYLPPPLSGLAGELSMRWQGRLSVEQLALDGELALDSATVGLENLQVESSSLGWQGSLTAGGFSGDPEFSVAGDISGTGLGVRDESRGLTLFELGALALETLSLDDSGRLSIARLDFNDMRAVDRGSEEQRLVQGRKLQLLQLEYQDNTLLVDSIAGEEVVSRLYITEEGDLVARGVLLTSLESLMESGEKETNAPPLQWRIGKTSALNSRLTVVNRQMEPPFRFRLDVEELYMGDMDSRQPESPTPVELKARFGEFGRLDMDGSIAGLAPEKHTELKGHIDSFPLHDLSPYTEYLLGYELVSGQYDHDFDISIRDAHIEASNELDLRKVKVKKLDDAEPVAPLPMPLGVALDLLRDRDDHISLSVPMEGQLDDPKFGLNQAISRALGKAMRSGSTTFLKLALQPYGAIWMGAEMGLKAAGQMQLDPMTFPAGSAEPGPEQIDYARKLAQILIDRPRMQLQICGKSGREDYAALQDQAAAGAEDPETRQAPAVSEQELRQTMLQLAEDRANTLKRWLVTDKGIAPERLYPCKPAADPAGKTDGLQLSI